MCLDQEKAEEKARIAEEKRVQKEANMVAKEKAKNEAAIQKEAVNAEKERLRQEAAVKKQAETAEKERLRAQKEAEKEEKRKSKDKKGGLLAGIRGGGAAGVATAAGTSTAIGAEASSPATATEAPIVTEPEGDTVHDQVTTIQTNEDDPFVDSKEEMEATSNCTDFTPATVEQGIEPVRPTTATKDEIETPTSPSKSDSKVKSWFKTRFRSGSKTQKDEDTSGFVGGAALTGTGVSEENEEPARSDSERNVALVGRSATNESEDMYGGAEPTTTTAAAPEAIPTTRSRSPSISSLSSSDYDEPSREAVQEGSVASDPPRGRRGFKERFLNKIHSKEPTSPTSAATDKPATTQVASVGEEEEEAKDTFAEEKLAPPPKLTDVVADDGPGPAIKAVSPTPASRERSKFTEEL